MIAKEAKYGMLHSEWDQLYLNVHYSKSNSIILVTNLVTAGTDYCSSDKDVCSSEQFKEYHLYVD